MGKQIREEKEKSFHYLIAMKRIEMHNEELLLACAPRYPPVCGSFFFQSGSTH